jgi:hypothetical protein
MLVAGGIATLAVLRGAPVAGVAVALALAGFGVGLAVPALEHGLLGRSDASSLVRILAVRHAAVTLALLALAPLVAVQLDRATERAERQQVSALLDSRVPPLEKIRLLPALTGAGEAADSRGELRRTFDAAAESTGDRDAVAELRERSDAILVDATRATVQVPLLVLAGTALAVVLVVPRRRRIDVRLVTATVVAAAAMLGTASATASWKAPEAPPAPCESPPPPSGNGPDHVLQDVVLRGLGRTACALGATREELLLAAASDDRSAAFQRRHGVDPRRALDRVLDVLLRLDPAAILGS